MTKQSGTKEIAKTSILAAIINIVINTANHYLLALAIILFEIGVLFVIFTFAPPQIPLFHDPLMG